MDRSFYLSLHSSHASPHRCSRVSLLCRLLIEDLHIIIEFDGVTKLGETRDEFEQAKRNWVMRDQNLRDAGWQVIRVSWPDYNDWEGLRIRLSRILGPMIPAPEFRFLWKPALETV